MKSSEKGKIRKRVRGMSCGRKRTKALSSALDETHKQSNDVKCQYCDFSAPTQSAVKNHEQYHCLHSPSLEQSTNAEPSKPVPIEERVVKMSSKRPTKLSDSVDVSKLNTTPTAPNERCDGTEETVECETVSTVLKRVLKKFGHTECRDDMSESAMEGLLIELYRKKMNESRLTVERRNAVVAERTRLLCLLARFDEHTAEEREQICPEKLASAIGTHIERMKSELGRMKKLSVDDDIKNRTIVDLATRMINAERKCADMEKELEKVAKEKAEIAQKYEECRAKAEKKTHDSNRSSGKEMISSELISSKEVRRRSRETATRWRRVNPTHCRLCKRDFTTCEARRSHEEHFCTQNGNAQSNVRSEKETTDVEQRQDSETIEDRVRRERTDAEDHVLRRLLKRFGHEAKENETNMEKTLTSLIERRHAEQLALVQQQQKQIEKENNEKKKMLERVAAIDQENMDLVGQMTVVVWERNAAVEERDVYKAKYEKMIRGVEKYAADNDSTSSVEIIE